MNGFIPEFIDNKFRENHVGTVNGNTLFFDISGFTHLTSELMIHGKNGADTLSSILTKIFGLVVDSIYSHGGFITTFAGDAATALFLPPFENNVFAAAAEIADLFDEHHLQRTGFGDYALDVKMGIDTGIIQWKIICEDDKCAYYFRGAPVDGAALAEQNASSREIVITDNVQDLPEKYTVETITSADGFRLLAPGSSPFPARGNNLSGTKTSQKEQQVESHEHMFYPVERISHITGGEFRDIISVFLSFREPGDKDKMEHVIRTVLSAAEQYEGYFNLLDFGDKGGVMLVLFGAPVSHEDDLHRAVSFADMVTSHIGESIRAGISSGTAYTGIIGGSSRKTYTALGSVVNLSARLAMAARWATVELSDSSARVISQRYDIENLGEREVKGFTEPVPVYRLGSRLNEVMEKSGQGVFVGRHLEKNILSEWMGSIPSGFQGIFYVYGQPGTGKSFLADTLIENYSNSIQVIHLYTDTILQKSMNPFVSIVTNILGLSGITSYKDYISTISVFLRNTGIENEELLDEYKRLSPSLANLVGIPVEDNTWKQLDPQGRFEMARSALAEMFYLLSVEKPLLIIIEDAHALDNDSKSIFDRILSTTSYRIGILALSREGNEQELPRITTQAHEKKREMLIGPMTRDDGEELAKQLLGADLAPDLFELIESKSGLNPLFLRELTDHLRVNRYISNREGTYELVRRDIDIPRSLSSIMVSRIDSLPENLKELVQTAAVIGREFNALILAALLKTDNISEALNVGIEQGILIPLTEDTYSFKQPVLQETAYSMQFESSLKEIHGSVARALQNRFRDDPRYFADLAYHFEKAELKHEAVDALEKAAEFSMSTFKNQKALEFIDRYLRLVADDAGRVKKYMQKGAVYDLTGRWDEAIESLLLGLGTAVIADLDHDQASIMSRLGSIYQKKGDSKKAVAVLNQAISRAGALNDENILSEAHVSLGRARWSTGDYDDASRALDNAVSHSKSTGNREMEALAYYYQGIVFRDTNRYDKAVDRYQLSLDILNTIGNDRLATYPLYDLGVVYQYQGRLNESWNYFMRSAEVYEKIGYESGLSAALLNLGVLKDRRGEFDKAIEYFGRSREIAERMGEELAIAYTIFSLGATYYKMGDLRKGLGYLKDSYTLFKRINAHGYFGYALSYLASLYATQGNAEFTIRTAFLHVNNMKKIGADVENGRTFLAVAMILEKNPELNDDLRKRLENIARFAGIDTIEAEAFYRKAIDVSRNASFMNTLIPAENNYGDYLLHTGIPDDGKKHLNIAMELAVSSGWNLMVDTIKRKLAEL